MATLRERNRERARGGIQAEALRLFLEQGYEATTTRQIAEASGVSPATLFRYFPGKDDILFWGQESGQLAKAVADRPAEESALAAVAGAVQAVMGRALDDGARILRSRLRLIHGTPALRSRQHEHDLEQAATLAGLIATRQGLPPEDFDIQILVSACVAVCSTANRVWALDEDDDIDLLQLLEDGFAQLSRGLPVVAGV